MMELQEIVKKLKVYNLFKLSEELGLHYNTLYGIKTGKKKNPSYNVVLKLSNYLENK